MPAKDHHDYNEELERLNYTLQYVDDSYKRFIGQREIESNKLSKMKKTYSSDNSQNYIDLMIQTMLNDRIELKIRNLEESKSKPYFSRIDFIEDGREEREKFYIGKMSLMKEEDNSLIIVDWRAPISNLYYDGKLGKENYACPDGRISGELLLKRQFVIHNRNLEEILDIDVAADDELLQTSLGSNADNRLKDIVSTIQTEQNKIIRADMFTPLIIQGVAGSGKTTIALHRIAYLIYTYEKSFVPENFMIIAPNRLFLNYISEVLPELGVQRVIQTTFHDFAMKIIGLKLKVTDHNEKLLQIINTKNSKITEIAQLKSSLEFKDVIEKYIENLESSILPKEDFKIFNYTIMKLEEIINFYYKELKYLPINKRIESIKKYLSKRLKDKKDIIIDQIENDCDNKIKYIKTIISDETEKQNKVIKILDDKNEKINKINNLTKKLIDTYINKTNKNAYQLYSDFITDENNFIKLSENIITKGQAIDLKLQTENLIKSGFVETEDLAPIMYIKYRFDGIGENFAIKHTVIDEAQDFSLFQYYVLKNILKDSSFTILGDICQGIHSHRGINDWNRVIDNVFNQKCGYLTLKKSYRTTIEIMNYANKVIDSLGNKYIKAEPVLRHGEKPEVILKENLKDIIFDIKEKIIKFKNDGFKSIAIICKSEQECKQVYNELKKQFEKISLITDKLDEYKGELVIVPSYLSKGLEFDAVLIANASSEEYKCNDLDGKLLYVSMTRALHKLVIYYLNECTGLLNKMDA